MWRILFEGLKKGVVPGPSPHPPDRFRGPVTLDPSRCDQTGACVTTCPTRAITLETRLDGSPRWEVDHAKCIFCGLCQEACPQGAISLGQDDRLAVRTKPDLRAAWTPAAEGHRHDG